MLARQALKKWKNEQVALKFEYLKYIVRWYNWTLNSVQLCTTTSSSTSELEIVDQALETANAAVIRSRIAAALGRLAKDDQQCDDCGYCGCGGCEQELPTMQDPR